MILNKIKFNFLENTFLLFSAVLLFMSVKSILPSVYTVFSLLILSFYFFPLKYLFKSFKIDYSIHLISDIIISISLVILIIAYYLDSSREITLAFSILNFVYLVFFIFKSNSLTLSKLIHRKVIINHLLTLLLLTILS